jgi:DNA-binding response OmpR family regulator
VTSSSSCEGFPDGDTLIPRFREAGDVTLDLLHRDGRVEDRWLDLDPRAFDLLWRLAEEPGRRLSSQQLLADAAPHLCELEADSLAHDIARVRARLEPFRLAHIVVSCPQGSYSLDAPPGPGSFTFAEPEDVQED